MRFSVWPTAFQPWDALLATARHAEETGWDGLWIADHFMGNPPGFPADTPTLEAGSVVAALAAVTEQARVGTLVFGNTYRHPAVVAKMAATVDHISGGRFTLGLGAGWQVNEHEQYGIGLPPAGELVERFGEAIQIVRGLLRQPTTTFAGRHYRVTDALCEPKPVQPELPILVGATGDRMLGIVARHADMWNCWGLPDRVGERSAALTRRCEQAGRDPDEIARSAQVLVVITDDAAEAERLSENASRPLMAGSPERLRDVMAAYAEVGLDEFIVPDGNLGPAPAKLDVLDRFISEVAPAFR